jgi:hypothetical protein
VPVGLQHDTLFSIARTMANGGISKDVIVAALRAVPLVVDPTRSPYADKDWDLLARSAKHSTDTGFVIASGAKRAAANLEAAEQHRGLQTRDIASIFMDPPPEPLIGQWIPRGALTAIYGPEWSGKTLVVLDWALSLASGSPWCGIELQQSRVLYVLGEGRLRERIQAWMHGHPDADPSSHFNVFDRGFSFADPAQVELLLQTVDDTRPAMVIHDTLANTIGGDENSNVDMGRVIDACKAIQRLTQFHTAPVLVCHPGKDTSKGIRGHSSLAGALEVSIRVSGTESSSFASEIPEDTATGGSVTSGTEKRARLPHQSPLVVEVSAKVSLLMPDTAKATWSYSDTHPAAGHAQVWWTCARRPVGRTGSTGSCGRPPSRPRRV